MVFTIGPSLKKATPAPRDITKTSSKMACAENLKSWATATLLKSSMTINPFNPSGSQLDDVFAPVIPALRQDVLVESATSLPKRPWKFTLKML